jgi:hypothetical protein
MALMRAEKTQFTAGEITPRLLGRGDLNSYDNGAGKLRNVFIHATGGLSRRDGLRYVATARGPGRLIAFEFNTEQVYLLAFSDQHLDIYRDDEVVADLATPWTLAQLAQIYWTQTADTLLVTHPEVKPRKITRDDGEVWSIADWTFVSEKDDDDDAHEVLRQPYHKFADDDVTLTPSSTSGTITLTASAAVFDASHIGARFRIQDKEVEIAGVSSATQATASTKQNLPNSNATKDWEEPAFSELRGWPATICFHQDRMVIGGSRDLPNRLWLSKSSDLFNFDLGEGLDDEAIEFAILSDHVNAIRGVFSGRHLQVFTSGAEWMVTGDPLTPAKVQLFRQTRIGSPTDRTVPPRDVDGATLFVPRSGNGLREFLYADVEQAYQALDLAMLADHLVIDPVSADYDIGRRLFHLVMSDGSLGTVTVYRAEKVTAWTRQETQGDIRSLAIVGNLPYLLVERANGVFVEKFDRDLGVDSGRKASSEAPATEWSGFGHLEGQTVTVIADGSIRPSVTVTDGKVVLDEGALEVEAGLAFSHMVHPLVPALSPQGGAIQGTRIRPVAITLRVEETASLRIDVGRGFVRLPFKRFGDAVLDAPAPVFSGDKKIRAYGWRRGGIEPLWKIEDDYPLPFHLLSVTTELAANS